MIHSNRSTLVDPSASIVEEDTEVSAEEKKRARIRRTNSFGERLNQIRALKQQYSENNLRSSSGSVPTDNTKQIIINSLFP